MTSILRPSAPQLNRLACTPLRPQARTQSLVLESCTLGCCDRLLANWCTCLSTIAPANPPAADHPSDASVVAPSASVISAGPAIESGPFQQPDNVPPSLMCVSERVVRWGKSKRRNEGVNTKRMHTLQYDLSVPKLQSAHTATSPVSREAALKDVSVWQHQ